MASITIRNLNRSLEARLRLQAAMHGRPVEDEARDILRAALSKDSKEWVTPTNLAAAIRARFAPLGGVDLPEVRREPMGKSPNFDE